MTPLERELAALVETLRARLKRAHNRTAAQRRRADAWRARALKRNGLWTSDAAGDRDTEKETQPLGSLLSPGGTAAPHASRPASPEARERGLRRLQRDMDRMGRLIAP